MSTAAFTDPHLPPCTASPGRSESEDRRFGEGWAREHRRLRELAALPEDWDGQGGKPAAAATVDYVMQTLAPLAAVAPAPSFSTSGEGDVWALWAEHGLDVELRFAGPGEIFAMIEDAQGRIGPYEKDDPDLARTRGALVELGRRAGRAAVARNHPTASQASLPENWAVAVWPLEVWPADTGSVSDIAAVLDAA